MSTSQHEAKPSFLDRLSDVLQKGRVALLVILIAGIVAVIGYFVWNELHTRAREKSTLWVEKAQDLHQQWVAEAEATKKQDLEKELNELLQRILTKYPGQYAAQRAQLLSADLAYRAKDWAKAAASYQALAKRFPRSYLAPLALMYAGACFEEQGDAKQALEAYERVRSRYQASYLMPRALFSVGRLLETGGDSAGAAKVYNQLEDDYPDSNWTKVARNRIIDLKIKGKIAE